MAVLAPHVTDENVDALIAEATHRRKLEIEMIVARLAPRPDAPDAVLPLSPAPDASTEPSPSPVAPPPRVQPLAPERFGLQTTISGATREQLERARALMRHRNPFGDLEAILDAALDALIAKLEKEKFAVTDRPRAAKPRPEDADPTYASAEVRRAVYERDEDRCTFRSPDGRRCTERGFLEIDHSTPACRKGSPTIENLRLLCHAHNQLAAEQALGADFVQAKREAAARDRDVTRALRGMGFKADETKLAMSNTAHLPASSLEDRPRTALAELTRMHGDRCGEGGVDAPVASWTTAFAIPHHTRADTPALGREGARALAPLRHQASLARPSRTCRIPAHLRRPRDPQR